MSLGVLEFCLYEEEKRWLGVRKLDILNRAPLRKWAWLFATEGEDTA